MVTSSRQGVPQAVGGNWLSEAAGCGFKQGIPQPRRIALPQAERPLKHPSLVPATRVRWSQAIVLELPDIARPTVVDTSLTAPP